jgi:hypothetical protein
MVESLSERELRSREINLMETSEEGWWWHGSQ